MWRCSPTWAIRSSTSARLGTTLTCSETGSPHAASASYAPLCVVGSKPSRAPMPWQTMPRSRVAVTFGSFWRREPAAALRGLANIGFPASTIEALSRSNAAAGRNTSPRTSTSAGTGCSSVPESRWGTEAIVLTLGVTSSPVRPSPRVSARTRRPCS